MEQGKWTQRAMIISPTRKNNFPCDTVCLSKDTVRCAFWSEGDQLTIS
jgi:hypothetical protein